MIKVDWNRDVQDFGFWRHTEQFNGESGVIAIPSSVSKASVAVHPEEGVTATVWYTLSSPSDIAGLTAKWISWNLGAVTEASADSLLSSITAIKATSDGVCHIELCAA